MFIKKGDTVAVIAGNDKGQRGQVTGIDLQKGQVTVQGLNMVKKHIKRGHPKNPQGGRLDIEMPMAVSKVALICPETNRPTRVGFRYTADGSKERYAKRSGASLGVISPAKASRAN
jgi:large subunit ribosomal protein L24